MKANFVFFLCFFSFSLAYSQDVKKEKHTKEHIDLNLQYCCVKKDYCGEKAKKCPNDQMPLIKNGMYYCPKCYNKSKKPGMCGKCDVALVKMEKKDLGA